jgi:hypothetical protein
MVLSTFLMLLLENWFTPLKVLYGLFLKACDIEPCAVIFGLISYNVWYGLNRRFFFVFFFCAVLTPASGSGPLCIQNNYFQFVYSLRLKKDDT